MKKIHNPTDTFAYNPKSLEPEIINYLDSKRLHGERQEFVTKAIKFFYEYENYKKGFLIRMMQENYSDCKRWLRKIGASIRFNFDKERKLMENTL
jgi:hypothetical protein